MKVVIIYRPDSEHGRTVEEFVRAYGSRYPATKLELLNIDGREGAAMASLYDVTAYPAVLVLQTDGGAIMSWQGNELPLLDELASYTLSAA